MEIAKLGKRSVMKIGKVTKYSDALKLKAIIEKRLDEQRIHILPNEEGQSEIMLLFYEEPTKEQIAICDAYISGVLDCMKIGHPGEIIFLA